jgi:hypothetical protein
MNTMPSATLKPHPRPHFASGARLLLFATALTGLVASTPGAVLQSARVEIAIDDTTGALQRITDRRDGAVLAGAVHDAYALQPTPENKMAASEAEDRVVARRGDVFVCENPKLPLVTIEKTYTVENSLVTKHVNFKANGNDLGFLHYSTGTNVPREFYQPGYLNNPTRHVVNTALPYFQVAAIEKEFQVFDINPKADHRLVIFTNPVAKRGLAQYRFKVDGHFSHPLSSYTYEPGLFYSPDGWRMAVAAKWLSQERGDTFSCDVRWQLFDGDHLAFHSAYLDLPEWKATWNTEVPAWMKEVKGVVTWDYTRSGPQGVTGWDPTQAGPADFPRIKAMAESMADGYIMVLVRGVFHNTRAYTADPIAGAYGEPIAQSQLQKWVRELQALSPRIKVGPITWQWAFADKDPVFKAHPEWSVHGSDGKTPVVVSAWEQEKASPQLLTPEAREFVLGQFAGMMKIYNFDFIYMDTGQGGITMLDWRSKRSAQDYDWGMLYQGIRDIARTHGGGSFLNGVPNLFSLYSDFGYYEGYNPHREHWQARSDRLVLAKVYQRPNDKRTIPLYWQDKDWTTESYPKLCYALAIKPGGFDMRGEFEPLRWPMIGALLEIEGAELMHAAQWAPCWWREKTDMEVYPLRLGQAGFLTVYNRGKDAQRADVSLDLTPYGFDPSKPVHVWRFDPKTLANLELENTEKLTEKQAAELFARTGRAPMRGVGASFIANAPYPKDGRFTQTLQMESGGVTLLMFTQAPKLALTKNARPTHFLLPATGAKDEQTVRSDEPLPAAIAAERQPAKSAILPGAQAAATSAPDGTPFEGGAVIQSFEGGAKMKGTAVEIPVGGAIEATGLFVTTLQVSRPKAAPPLEFWITYSRATDFPKLHKHGLDRIEGGAEAEVHLDLNHFAPPDWTGRVRLETKGEGGAIRIIFNSKLQLF